MAESVVHFFEVINVAQNYGHSAFFAVAARACDFALQNVHNHTSIPQTGERIMRGFKAHLFARLHQIVLQMQNALSGAQPRPQFFRIERLCQVIVSARCQSRDDVFLGLARGQQNHVRVRHIRLQSDRAHHFHAIQPRHHPIQQRQAWRVWP
jgi:hypothetical protein